MLHVPPLQLVTNTKFFFKKERRHGRKKFNKSVEATLSTQFYGDRTGVDYVRRKLQAFIQAANDLDKIKRQLFYGEGYEELAESAKSVASTLPSGADKLLHGLIGVATEAGELSEHALPLLDGEVPLHESAVAEELGDLEFYESVVRGCIGISQEWVMQINHEKRESRFPDGFTQNHALNRDLGKENEILTQEKKDK